MEMEAATLGAVGRFRRVSAANLLYSGDDLRWCGVERPPLARPDAIREQLFPTGGRGLPDAITQQRLPHPSDSPPGRFRRFLQGEYAIDRHPALIGNERGGPAGASATAAARRATSERPLTLGLGGAKPNQLASARIAVGRGSTTSLSGSVAHAAATRSKASSRPGLSACAG